jgi:hypothetical protein
LPPDVVKVEVYVGLAHDNDTALIAQDGAAARRFKREVRAVVDTNNGSSPQELEWADPNIQILYGSERKDGFATIRVAELLRQENGQFQVLDTRIPPVAHLSAAPFLENGVRRVLANIVARQQQLVGERRQRQLVFVRLKLILERADLGHELLSQCLVLRTLGLADLLRGCVAPCLHFLQPRLDRAQFLVQLDQVLRSRGFTASLEAGVERGGVVANGLDIEHWKALVARKSALALT